MSEHLISCKAMKAFKNTLLGDSADIMGLSTISTESFHQTYTMEIDLYKEERRYRGIYARKLLSTTS